MALRVQGRAGVYSDFGDAIACAFPGNTYQISGVAALVLSASR